jgi:hypothetical protein
MPSGFNIPTGITTVGNSFFLAVGIIAHLLTSMPSGFNIPTGITSVGSYFLRECWYNCTSLNLNASGLTCLQGLQVLEMVFFINVGVAVHPYPQCLLDLIYLLV